MLLPGFLENRSCYEQILLTLVLWIYFYAHPGLEFSTPASSKKMFLGNCNDDRRLEVAIWSPKREVRIPG